MKTGLSAAIVGILSVGTAFGVIQEGEFYRGIAAAQGTVQTISFDRAYPLTAAPAKALREGGEYVLDNGGNAQAVNGLSWGLPLNQKTAMPFSVSAESLFESGAEGSGTTDYSIYLDVRYADGTSLYGQTHCFKPKAGKGWQKGTVTVTPDKPVKAVSCYLLLRHRDGRVRFREPKLTVYPANDLAVFDTVPVQVVNPANEAAYLLHDAANPDDGWTALRDGAEAKGFRFGLTRTVRDGATFFEARLDSLTDDDRAMTFACSIPLPEGDLVWLDDPRKEIAMGSGQYRNTVNVGCGACALSRWPFGAVRAGGRTYALGYDPDAPAVFRVTANARLRRLFIAFDLGFAKEKKDARFKFVAFGSPGADGFRGAFEKYRSLFPEAYKVRIRKHGIWMAFHRISTVEGWEDFGFGIKEGDGESAWDDAHGILTTHYTEPTSWWMTINGTNAVTMAEALAKARAEAAKPKGHPYAKAWVASTYHDEDGEITGNICDRPWCRGACWNMNPLPAIPGGEYEAKLTGPAFEKRYADKSLPEGVDGEYIDSAECHLPPRIDFRRENFRYSKTPLCWSKTSFRPGVSTALAIYEYVRGVADRVHAMGRVMQANGAPYSWPWLIPFVDYGGQETKWIERGEGKWCPQSDEDLLYRMAMACGKPYCFLMNVKFENLTDEMVEKYFHRCLAYGLMSSFFSPNASGGHYFSRPELYNRHRPLFLKYGPLQRMVSEAGWRPVNRLAVSETKDVFAEQFGDRYVTLFNPGDKPATVRVRSRTGAKSARELVVGATWTFADGVATAEIPPETARLLDFGESAGK